MNNLVTLGLASAFLITLGLGSRSPLGTVCVDDSGPSVMILDAGPGAVLDDSAGGATIDDAVPCP